jgi:hypothetical protein
LLQGINSNGFLIAPLASPRGNSNNNNNAGNSNSSKNQFTFNTNEFPPIKPEDLQKTQK